MLVAFVFLSPFKHYSGMEEAVYRNITACKDIAQIVRTSFGPNGMNKMIVNHLDKLFVTSDAATIINELEVRCKLSMHCSRSVLDMYE